MTIQPRPKLMGRRHYSHGDNPNAFMHYNDLRVSRGWLALMLTVRWDLLRMYQADFAKLLNTHKMQISRWENGTTPIPANVITRLLELMGEMATKPQQVVAEAEARHWGAEARARAGV